MADKTYQGAIVEKVGDEFCVMKDGETVKCYPTEDAAKEGLKAMADTNKGKVYSEEDLERIKADVRKEYEAKQRSLEDENTKMAARVGTLESSRRQDRIDGWIADQKKAGKLPPVMEPRVRAIREYLREEGEVKCYSDKGEEIKRTPARMFEELIESYPTNRILVAIDNLENILVDAGTQKECMDRMLYRINVLKKRHFFISFVILNQMNNDILKRIDDLKRQAPIPSDMYGTGQLFKVADAVLFKIMPTRFGIEDKFMVFGKNRYPHLDAFKLPSNSLVMPKTNLQEQKQVLIS